MRMFRWSILCAVALMLCAQVASAATVSYFTTGSFNANSLPTMTHGGLTVTYTAQPLTVVNTVAAIDLGHFQAFGTTSGTFSDAFTLYVFQVIPSAGSQSLAGTLSGTMSFSAGVLSISFLPSSFSLGIIDYTVFNPTILSVPAAGQQSNVKALVATAAPLPAAGWAGMALLGLLGVARIRRRMAA